MFHRLQIALTIFYPLSSIPRMTRGPAHLLTSAATRCYFVATDVRRCIRR